MDYYDEAFQVYFNVEDGDLDDHCFDLLCRIAGARAIWRLVVVCAHETQLSSSTVWAKFFRHMLADPQVRVEVVLRTLADEVSVPSGFDLVRGWRNKLLRYAFERK